MDWSKIIKSFIITFEIVILLIIFAMAYISGKGLGYTIVAMKSNSDIQQLDNYNQYELPSIVYDINGEVITKFTSVRRNLISFQDLPENLIYAFIAVEDARFYKHKGIDSYSILRALLKNIKAKKIIEGGSTISQQLVKIFFTDNKKTLARKLVELWYTLLLERRYTKYEILEKYLNTIYFGHGIYGVAAASQFYFNKKNIKNLTMCECSLLAAIPQAPLRYSPFIDLESAKKKQILVLKRMKLRGYLTTKINSQSYLLFWQQLKKRQVYLSLIPNSRNRQDEAPYFSEYVKLMAEKYFTEKLGWDKNVLFNGGFKIYTGLDLKKQALARKHLQNQLYKQDKVFTSQTKHIYHSINKQHTDLYNFLGLSFLDSAYHFRYKQRESLLLNKLKNESDLLEMTAGVFSLPLTQKMINNYRRNISDEDLSLKTEGAIVSIDPETGFVVAMIGGRKFSFRNQFNRAVFAKRQPGSTFKAFVYAFALKMKQVHPDTIVAFKTKYIDGEINHIPITLKDALRLSINSVATDLINYFGSSGLIDFSAPLLGIKKSRLPDDPSLALGTGEVTPLELCKAMAVFANDGKEVIPIVIRKILDKYGNVIIDFEKENRHKSRQLISANLAHLITNMLKQVVLNGTASKAVRTAGFYRPCAGKTGSTDNYKDAWFAGYTPNLVTTVWIGFDTGMSLGYGQFGGNVAAPVWAKYMRDVHIKLPYKDFNKPKSYPPFIKYAHWVAPPEIESNFEDLDNNEIDMLAQTNPEEDIDSHDLSLNKQTQNNEGEAESVKHVQQTDKTISEENKQNHIDYKHYHNRKTIQHNNDNTDNPQSLTDNQEHDQNHSENPRVPDGDIGHFNKQHPVNE